MSAPRTLVVVCVAGAVGGLGIGLVDTARGVAALGSQSSGNVIPLCMALLGRYGVTGAALGLLFGFMTVTGRRLAPRGRDRAAALVGLGLGAALSWKLYSGPAISDHPMVWPLRLVTPLAVAVGAAVFVRVLAFAAGRSGSSLGGAVVASVFVAAAVCGDTLDTWAVLGAYGYLRTILWVLVMACLGLAVAIPWSAKCGHGAGRGMTLVLVAGLLAALAPPEDFVRFAFRERTRYGARCLDLWRLLSRSETDRGDVTEDEGFAARRLAELSPARRDRIRSRLDAAVPDRGDWNLLWITVDTLRADGLSCYGRRPVTTPVLDQLAAKGTRFANAASQFPITHYSFQSMFYGRYPTATPLFRSSRDIDERQENNLTLAGLLRERGFYTGTVPGVPATELGAGQYQVMAEGFEVVQPGRPKTWRYDGPAQTHCALTFLEQAGDRRWCLWLHYMEPHRPYRFHEEHDFGNGLEERYLSEIARADAEIGRVMEALRERGELDRTVIVVNSDHGEAFGHHGTWYHGSTLYEEQLHVPLIVRAPQVGPRVITNLVENVDIMPTVLDLLDIDHELPLQGSSLIPLMLGGDGDEDAPEQVQLAELPGTIAELSSTSANRDAFRHEQYKFIWNPTDGIAELYDMAVDPGELLNVAAERPDVLARMQGMLAVLKRECRTINRDPVEAAPGLLDQVRELPSEERVGRLMKAVRGREPGLREALPLVLQDPGVGERERRLLLLACEPVLGSDVRPFAWGLLAPDHGWASAVAGLDLLLRGPRDDRTAAEERDETLRSLLTAPRPVALRAAVMLARAGDDAGRTVLQGAAAGPRGLDRLLGQVGLSMSGDASHRPSLEARVVPLATHPERAVLVLEGLAGVPASSVVPALWDLLQEPFVDHRVRAAALSLLSRLDPADAAIAWSASLSAGDPEGQQRARQVADQVLGPARRAELEAAGRAVAGARDGAAAGRTRAAVDLWLKAAASLGDDRSAAPCLLQAARSWHLLGRTEERDALCDRVRASGAVDAWKTAARHLPAALRAPDRLPLVIEEVEASPLVSQVPSQPGLWRARVRNPGPAFLPGGRWPVAPLFLAGFARGEDRLPFSVRKLPLADGGLPAGETAWVWLPGVAPAEGGDLSVRLAGVWPGADAVNVPAAFERTLPLSFPGRGAEGADPAALSHDGEAIRGAWILSPQVTAASVDAEGAFTWAATGDEAWLMSPLLKDEGQPLQVKVALAAVSRHQEVARVRVDVAYGSMPGEAPMRSMNLPIPADGEWVERTAVFPPLEGVGVRWFRVAPLEGAELIRIRQVDVRTRP